jgi:16S rRNA (uracil1498-N3)-methyltransferase
MSRVFLKEIGEPNTEVFILEEEAHHLLHVLRVNVNDAIELFDGQGTLAPAIIQYLDKKKCVAKILSKTFQEKPWNTNICFGIPKQASLEFIIKRCTEVGVESFQPLITNHSIHTKDFNIERWQQLCIEACKQSQNLWLPQIKAPQNLKNFLEQRESSRVLYFCDENVRDQKLQTQKIAHDILIGPEGGWSKEEITLIQKQNPQLLSLGQNRLRTEMAALVSLILVKFG